MSPCCLCSKLVSADSSQFWDRPLLETPNFVVIPSLGSLVEGWLLVIPKQHFICIGALPTDLELELKKLKGVVAAMLAKQYGEVCAFEHGPNEANRKVGCGVDHAHLHLVPLKFDLRNAAEPFMPFATRWQSGSQDSCRTAFKAGQEYLYIEQPLGCVSVATHTEFGSQILRKAIAAHIGALEQFSWRDYPQVEVISRTIRALHGALT
jgi:diadenosine tetraphosphate (Ap4A) HIT family hydrolase